MAESQSPKRILELDDLGRIDRLLESLYPESVRLAAKMVGLETSQVRKLQTLVTSTTRFSEILNFVKNQAGKRNKTAREWVKVAPQMIRQLEEFEEKARTIEENNPEKILAIKLRLAHGWVKQLVAHYLYVKPQKS